MLSIAGRTIGAEHRPYLIAEMSGNHNQSLERAFAIIDAAAKAGADAVKLQTYTADTLTLDSHAEGFVIRDPQSLWNGRQLYELYREAHTPWDWHKPLMERAAGHGMACFSTPFDDTAVDFLESLDVPAYKVASFECTHLPLIRKIAATGKPMIISTGMATREEIMEAVQTARATGCRDIVLLKCTSTYPASPENTNIRTIPDLCEMSGCEVGLSDHTMGCGAALAAVALGAVVIEKHFTLRRADGGVDSAFSMEPEELELLRRESEKAWLSLGKITYGGSEAEQKSKAFRQSLYIAEDVKPGDRLVLGAAGKLGNLRIVRPGFGLPPKCADQVVGRTVKRAAKAGTPLSWDLLDERD
ncbi:MAG TPA: pseudaminic acid synthase [Alphaproteobacteria bacterium]|nr:pseudaminic acid synthase [Alphaproteobacteria bacterium]